MITDMTTREKSVMLAKLAGWIVQRGAGYAFVPGNGLNDYYSHLATLLHQRPEHVTPNLYNPDNMALAWAILNWAASQDVELNDYAYPYTMADEISVLFGDEYDGNSFPLWTQSPTEAQAIWLDKILEIAIEAGMITP